MESREQMHSVQVGRVFNYEEAGRSKTTGEVDVVLFLGLDLVFLYVPGAYGLNTKRSSGRNFCFLGLSTLPSFGRIFKNAVKALCTKCAFAFRSKAVIVDYMMIVEG